MTDSVWHAHFLFRAKSSCVLFEVLLLSHSIPALNSPAFSFNSPVGSSLEFRQGHTLIIDLPGHFCYGGSENETVLILSWR